MAARTTGVFTEDLQNAIKTAKLLVVGAGGIGCELLKDLVLTGFEDIEIIDLDTIDVSNLNRQFLFQKQHVGKSKAKVARESVLRFNPNANIVAHHDSVISNEYGVNYFKKFKVVLNALDNRAARNHVNRLCLAANVPLVESGTSGYSGQVELILKGKTKCYECDPKAPQKTYPGCTIRNTPSEPIHCIVWAKHLFNQLFGEEDPDEDVSPDTADPEAAGDAGENALKSEANNKGNVERVSTRAWAQSTDYDPKKLFVKLFNEDILYLLKMENLWKSRRPPQPLELSNLPDATEGSSSSSQEASSGMKDQRLWSVAECAEVFTSSINGLKAELQGLGDGLHLTWDKDNKFAMDFVAASANLRAHIYGIPLKSRFDIKSMAGNIIPAIATSNAIIAGLVVMHTLNILKEDIDRCQSVYLRVCPNHRGHLIVPERCLIPPNSQCRVCAETPQVTLCTDLEKMTCKELEVSVLKNYLNMAAPDVVSAKGSVIISSDEGETENNNDKTLKEVGIADGTILVADDFLQNYSLKIIMTQRDMSKEETNFLVVGDISELQPKKEEKSSEKNGGEKDKLIDDDDDDDVEMVEDVPAVVGKKRKQSDSEIGMKKRKTADELEHSTPSGSYNDPITL